MTNDISFIGNEIKNIRKNKGLTQEELAFSTTLSVDTIRRLESGNVDVKLSSIVAVFEELGLEFDIIFNQSQGSVFATVNEYITQINFYMSEYEYEKSISVLEELKQVETNTFTPSYLKKYNQYIKFYQTIIENPKADSIEFINGLNEAINITLKDFKIENFKKFNYSNFEFRILSSMVPYYEQTDNKYLSYEILNFILDNISINNKIFPKISYNISRAYTYDKNFEEALYWNDKSIESCIINNDLSMLIHAYYQKGDIYIKTRNIDAIDYINKSFDLCDMTGRKALKNNLKTLLYNQ